MTDSDELLCCPSSIFACGWPGQMNLESRKTIIAASNWPFFLVCGRGQFLPPLPVAEEILTPFPTTTAQKTSDFTENWIQLLLL